FVLPAFAPPSVSPAPCSAERPRCARPRRLGVEDGAVLRPCPQGASSLVCARNGEIRAIIDSTFSFTSTIRFISHFASFSRSLITVGLGVAALLFAGRYAFQIWKPLEQVITETAKKIPCFTVRKLKRQEDENLIKLTQSDAEIKIQQWAGCSDSHRASAGKARIRAAYRRTMIFESPR
uniref:dnaJ homolog subfamily C member 15 n=1 Tax=Callithrix jacchus TaxID=9483 RepID=UPI0023DD354F